jgi:hypothetical protein
VKIDTTKLRSIALESLEDARPTRSVEDFKKMGYLIKVQARRLNLKTKRKRWDKPPADPTKKIVWFILGRDKSTESIYWMGIPREFAKKVLVFGFLPTL